MKSCERDKLKFVAHGAKLILEPPDRSPVEVLIPVERRRTIIGEEFLRKSLTDRLRKLSCLAEIGRRGLAPQHIAERSVGKGTRDCKLEPAPHREKPIGSSIS